MQSHNAKNFMIGGPSFSPGGNGFGVNHNMMFNVGMPGQSASSHKNNTQYPNTIRDTSKKSNFTVQRANLAAAPAGSAAGSSTVDAKRGVTATTPVAQPMVNSSLSQHPGIPTTTTRWGPAAPPSASFASPSPGALGSYNSSQTHVSSSIDASNRHMSHPVLVNGARAGSQQDPTVSMQASQRLQQTLSGRTNVIGSETTAHPRPTFLDGDTSVGTGGPATRAAGGSHSRPSSRSNGNHNTLSWVGASSTRPATGGAPSEERQLVRVGSSLLHARAPAYSSSKSSVAESNMDMLQRSSDSDTGQGLPTTDYSVYSAQGSEAQHSTVPVVMASGIIQQQQSLLPDVSGASAAGAGLIMQQSYFSTSAAKKGQGRFLDMKVCKGRFVIKTQIGAGSFGELFWGMDTWSDKEVAIKLEPCKVRQPQLLFESRLYKLLHSRDTGFHPSITRCHPEELMAEYAVVSMDENRSPVEMLPSIAAGDQGGTRGRRLGRGRNGTGVAAAFRELMEVVGFPTCHYYGTEGDFNVMVMDLLGPNLEDLFNYCNRHLSIKSVCLLADQMLHRIEYLHHKGFIHRDLKPENFVMGGDRDKGHIVHLIDFGLSKRYWDTRVNQHIPYKEGKSLTGTARYCSVNAHLGIEQSRRDDLESLGYILLYFLKKGFLPWQGIRGTTDPQTKNVRISEKKISTSLEVLCRDEPSQVFRYMKYVRELKFEETPDYRACREFFAQLLERHHQERDWVFDWAVRRDAERRAEQRQQLTVMPAWASSQSLIR